MTNPERREKMRKILEILRCNIIESVEDGTIDPPEELRRQREFISDALSALEALMPDEVMSEEEIYKIVYAVERKTCASEECEITCPAYKENEEYPCGARQRSRELAKALTIAKPVMTKEEVDNPERHLIYQQQIEIQKLKKELLNLKGKNE